MRHFISRLLIAGLLLLGFTVPTSQAAAEATVNGATNASNYTVGDTITLTVDASITDFTSGAIEVRTNYDSQKLEFQSSSGDGSVFGSEITSEPSSTNSRYTARASSGATGANQRVVRYTFKATATGTATFSFTDLKIAEANTGVLKAISGTTNSVEISAQATPTPTPSPTAAPTTTTTPKPTVKPTAKPKPKTTAKPTTTPAATPAPNNISASQSSVTTTKDTAIADGIDFITMCVLVKRDDGTVVTDVEPTVTGLRADSDTATAQTFDSTSQSWCSDISSIAEGVVTTSINAGAVVLASKDLTFTADVIAPTDTPIDLQSSETKKGLPFWILILLGLLFLLLILFLLWWLYKRLRDRNEEDQELENLDDDTGPAYPGDETNLEEPAAEPTPTESEPPINDQKPTEPEPPTTDATQTNEPPQVATPATP